MSQTSHKLQVVKAMDDFRKSYHSLLSVINDYEALTESSINDLPGFTDGYPFDKSLDELPIEQWYFNVASQLHNVSYTVLNYEYLNTGGNTMVGIHEVWLPVERKTVYIYTNEEGCVMSLVDYIRNEFEPSDYDSVQIDVFDLGRVTGWEKYFELYRRCYNDYLKDDCRYFGYVRGVQYILLSDELQKKVDADYYVWCEANGHDLIDTNGCDIIEHPDYTAQFDDGVLAKLQDIKDWLQWHDELVNPRTSDDELEAMYDEVYELTFKGRTVKLPFDADVFNNVNALVDKVIKEW